MMSTIVRPSVEFCCLAEAGILEQQALLLCESIRRFAGRYADARLTVISPRAARRPATGTVDRLRELKAQYVTLDLLSPTPEYGPSYKTLALGWCARQAGPDILVQLDSDTVFLGEPDFALNGHAALARPVDVKGMCSRGPGDGFEPIWQRMCAACGVDIETLGYVRSTVDNQLLRASFNGGLIAARRHVFQIVAQCFLRIAACGIRPFAHTTKGMRSGSGPVSIAGHEMWGTTQAAISLAVAKLAGTVGILDAGANVPLHMMDDLDTQPMSVVHLHYHWLFEADRDSNPAFDSRLGLPPEQMAWLRQRLPLRAGAAPDAHALPGLTASALR